MGSVLESIGRISIITGGVVRIANLLEICENWKRSVRGTNYSEWLNDETRCREGTSHEICTSAGNSQIKSEKIDKYDT